ncbi:MAG: FAD-binding oxidoreductase [Patescibacteria group bacterium]|nr:FAD-binding oxidoreductase [Patescibacteria group bacterium]
MIDFIDRFLNKITMYRLTLYALLFLLASAFGVSFFGALSFSPASLVLSLAIILGIALLVNKIFSIVFEAPTNVESVYITSFILALIITPVSPSHLFSSAGLGFFAWAAIWAMASKFIFSFNKKHIFNPAAFAVALTAFTIGQAASWWVGTLSMLPFTAAIGFLIVRKIRRLDMVLSFGVAAILFSVAFNITKGVSPITSLLRMLAETPIVFLGTVMLTEPLTTPPTRGLRIVYGAIIGLLFPPILHLGSVYSTPELGLLVGNIFSFITGPKGRHVLKLKEKKRLTNDVYEFSFETDRKVGFLPGQYMEWTLKHDRPDNRGNRRFFTIASSPDEKEVKLGVKFYPSASSFKQALFSVRAGETVIATQPAGDFLLPKDKNEKVAFIAGGIGITPFKSMVSHLISRREKRDAVLFYSAQTPNDLAYKEMFDEAGERIGLKTVYTVTSSSGSNGWNGRMGFLTGDAIREEAPDYLERTFYISGPRSLVNVFRKTLKEMGVSEEKIKTDYFPGLV